MGSSAQNGTLEILEITQQVTEDQHRWSTLVP